MSDRARRDEYFRLVFGGPPYLSPKQKLAKHIELGYPAPEGPPAGMYKCPRCTFMNDDLSEMLDHIVQACDLAYNDPDGSPYARKELTDGQ